MGRNELPDAGFADDARVERVEDMIAAEVENEVVIMHIGSGNFYQLNSFGARVWDQLETPATVASLCARLQEKFDVAPDVCRNDVTAFLIQLRDSGVIRIS
jgi:hypothetical protein